MKNPRNRSLHQRVILEYRPLNNERDSHTVIRRSIIAICMMVFCIVILGIAPAGADPSCTITPGRLYADNANVSILYTGVDNTMQFEVMLISKYVTTEDRYGILAGEMQTESGFGEGFIEYLWGGSGPFEQYRFLGEMPGSQYTFYSRIDSEEEGVEMYLPMFFGGDIQSPTTEELIVIPLDPLEYSPPNGILEVMPCINFYSVRDMNIPFSFNMNRPVVTVEDVEVPREETVTGAVSLKPMNDGLVRYDMTVSLESPGVAQITNAYFPPGVTGDISLSDQSVTVKAVCDQEGYSGSVPLLYVVYRANGCCATEIVPVIDKMTDQAGYPVDPSVKNGILTVTGYEQPVAAFEASPREFAAPGDVAFLDRSTGSVTGWLWKFGDGGTSTEQNPYHRYENPGTYTVNLSVSGPAGSAWCEKVGYIRAGTMPLWFYADKTTGSSPLTVQFNATSVTAPDTWSWYFGDGEISGVRNATHTYTKPGEYTVRLTATKGENSNRAIRYKYITVSA